MKDLKLFSDLFINGEYYQNKHCTWDKMLLAIRKREKVFPIMTSFLTYTYAKNWPHIHAVWQIINNGNKGYSQ
jgi:hypothetical protein